MTAVGGVRRGTGISFATLAPPRALLALAADAAASGVAPQYPLDPVWAERVPEIEAALFTAVNADRLKNGLHALVRDPLLDEVAYWAAAQRGWALYLDHTDHIPAGQVGNTTGAQVDRPFGARFWDFGYPGSAIGENLAYGFLDAASVEAAFMSDVGHRDNILNGSYVAVGLGVARTTMSCAPGLKPQPGMVFTCQDFGAAPVEPTPPPGPGPGPTPPPPHDMPAVGDTWVSHTNAKATVHVDAVFSAKKGAVKVTYTNRKGEQITTTLARFTQLFTWKATR